MAYSFVVFVGQYGQRYELGDLQSHRDQVPSIL